MQSALRPSIGARAETAAMYELADGVCGTALSSARCQQDIAQDLYKLVSEPTPSTAAALLLAAEQLQLGAGRAVRHLRQPTTLRDGAVRGAVLQYLATSHHCCDRAELQAMLDAHVVKLIVSSLDHNSGGDAHLLARRETVPFTARKRAGSHLHCALREVSGSRACC